MTAPASALPISKDVVNGSTAWSASVLARPSRKRPPLGLPSEPTLNAGISDAYISEGVLRKPVWFMPAPPMATGEPWSTPLALASSAKAAAVTWQLAQDCVPETDSDASLKIFWPNCAAADNGVVPPVAGGGAESPPPPPQAASSRDTESASPHPLGADAEPKPGIVIVCACRAGPDRPTLIGSAIAIDSQSMSRLYRSVAFATSPTAPIQGLCQRDVSFRGGFAAMPSQSSVSIKRVIAHIYRVSPMKDGTTASSAGTTSGPS